MGKPCGPRVASCRSCSTSGGAAPRIERETRRAVGAAIGTDAASTEGVRRPPRRPRLGSRAKGETWQRTPARDRPSKSGSARSIERVAKVPAGYGATVDIFRELGVKSAAALDLLLSLEEEFDISIGDDVFAEARTTAQIVALVDGLKGAAE